jgi:aminoglycoside phosphotransferase (APT) family kinase protein
LVDGLVGKLFNGVATTEATEAVGIMEATATTEPQRAYLLHGDTGVHNFVFHDRALVGVIDPSPVIGPILYDFLYAFCSSPDDLSAETLLGAYRLLRNKPVDERRLIEEAAVQLYCRIGICLMHHPQDRDAYLDAWAHWKTLLPEAGK